ncbi:MAG: crotonase/enoyl-CoA hydratase family protein [Myxococcota bacterium]
MSDRVSISIDASGVADVRLNWPDKMNACDSAMFSALDAVGREVASNPSVRAVVLSGEGRAFCAGLDVQSFGKMSEPRESSRASTAAENSELLAESARSAANFAQRAAWVWTEVPVPVIAAVHGVAFGAGIQIALAADIRFIAPDARMSVMEVKWGLIPDVTGTQTLRRLVRLDIAKELTFSGRIVPGTEAVELGLATHLSDTPREAALELAREIAARSPDAIRAGKHLLNESVQVSVDEGLRLESSIQATLIGTPNQTEAVRANLEKRTPAFSDPKA